MLPFFNQKELVVCSNQSQYQKYTSLLEKEGIGYRTKVRDLSSPSLFSMGTRERTGTTFQKVNCQTIYTIYMFNTILLLVSRQQQEGENVEINIPEEIEAAVAYFNENYNTKISVEDYAESLHISTNWFIRNFKQYMKISPAQYILSLRMVNAQSLLENTDYKIGEIAEIVGYDNQLYFSRVFRKEYGVSSAQYRKKMEKSSLSK